MRKNLLVFILVTGSLFNVCAAGTDTQISGFASFVAGRASNDDQFLSDYPRTGIYDEDWSFSPDTSLGIQLNHTLKDAYSLVIQINAHGARDYEPEISWAYINYQINAEFSVQLGRKRLPLYYYSDFFDVGYAYNWIRPPADNYTWQITHYNGINLRYETHNNGWESSINIYSGREDSNQNDLLSYLSGQEVDETWKNMLGVVGEFSYQWINVRLTAMSSELDRRINDTPVSDSTGQIFTGVSINLFPGNLSVLSEFNSYDRDDDDIRMRTRMISLAYNIDDFTPYMSYSEFNQSLTSAGGDEEHNTRSIGIRWDFMSNTAFKVQLDRVTDDGVVSPVLGDSESLSLGIDTVF